MTQAQIYIYGIDLGKNWFHLVAMDRMGHVMTKQKLTRSQLKQFISTTSTLSGCLRGMSWFAILGAPVPTGGVRTKIIPAQFVKPYLKSNKNDFNDATAIAEAGSRGSMRCVPLKSHEQLALQATHRVRQRFIVERTATVNQMRALLLEYGLTVPVGRKVFERSLPTILEDAEMACLTLSAPWYCV
ncbi:IS110 family transposase [Aeromonas veronii]|uniref:IS110 family transposase n=1 Tax=Aeromonas veronii TaxID=654 RepID=UPI00208F50B6|nr:transposase [Aeromonas veronii]